MNAESLATVIAFIQPFQLDAVVDALRRTSGFPGVSVSDVRGFGRHGAHWPHEGESAEVVPLEKKTRLEIYCFGSEATSIMETIRQAAHTGHEGDGMIFVIDVAWAMRIRSGAFGSAALNGANLRVDPDEPLDGG